MSVFQAAAEKLMGSSKASLEHKRKEKRDAEGDGRDLLVAYLSDVGGYDRDYRDVGDEDESGSSGNKSRDTDMSRKIWNLLCFKLRPSKGILLFTIPLSC